MGIELNEKDAANLQEIKDKMAEMATGKGLLGSPDAAAAAAFARLLDAETRREELIMQAARQGKSAQMEEEKIPSAATPNASWMESVTSGRPVTAALDA